MTPIIKWLEIPGLIKYGDSLEIVNRLVQEVIEDNSKIYVILLEYEDVYTMGRSAQNSDIISTNNIEVFQTDRGGKTTYHGPGQRIIYPIFYLKNKDIRAAIKFISDVTIKTLEFIGIKAYYCEENIGIWTENNKKIASIGLKVKKWVTYHGIAINIRNHITKFNNILACGLHASCYTSIKQLGIDISNEEFDKIFKQHFENLFQK